MSLFGIVALLLAGIGDEVVYRKAHGSRSVEPGREPMTVDQLRGKMIAIPGELTTANLLLQLHGIGYERLQILPFDRIVAAVAQELEEDWTDRVNISTPLRRLLAVHRQSLDNGAFL